MKTLIKGSRLLWKKNHLILLLAFSLAALGQGIGLEGDLAILDGTLVQTATDFRLLEEEGQVLPGDEIPLESPYYGSNFIKDPKTKKAYEAVLKDRAGAYSKDFFADLSHQLDRLVADPDLGLTGLKLDKADWKEAWTNLSQWVPTYMEGDADSLWSQAQYAFADYYETMGRSFIYNPSEDLYQDLDGASLVLGVSPFLLLLGGLMALVLTSGERLTSYYEFSQGLPWSKEAGYGHRIVFGAFLLLVFWALTTGLRLLVLLKSPFAEVVSFYRLPETLLSQGALLFGFYFFCLGLGMAAGNILGHLGLLVIGFMGLDLFYYNLSLMNLISQSLFNGRTFLSPLVEAYVDYQAGQSILVYILSPYQIIDKTEMTGSLIMGGLGLAALLLGRLFLAWRKEERSGQAIMVGGLNGYAKFLAIWTTGGMITSLIYWSSMNISSLAGSTLLIVYGLACLVSAVFYHKFFNLRWGL
ncbi:MAG: hypothetical protein Q4E37_06240 [Tissierellia bacterium]|nr:hypothetical protein [Tissierellia bacterium]